MLAGVVAVTPNEHIDKEICKSSIIRKAANQSFRTDKPSCNK